MAGTITEAHQEHRTVRKLTLSWITDGSGVAIGTSSIISGLVYRIVTNPGTAAPTALYDLVLNDEDGMDIAAGALSDRATADTEQVILDPPIAVDGTLQLAAINAGDTKQGTVVIYYR